MTRRKVLAGLFFALLVLPLLLLLAGWLTFYALLSAYAPNRITGTIDVGGRPREYLLHVPPGYTPGKPVPLVISLHAAMNWPAFQQRASGWDRLADEQGFIVVYPAGEGVGPRQWPMAGARRPADLPDVAFIDALIDHLQALYTIDAARIHASGYSHGAFLAYALACARPHRIAAIGTAAGAQPWPASACGNEARVPMIAFHGTADAWVPYDGGPVAIAPQPFAPVRAWLADLARRNRCSAGTQISTVARGVTRTAHTLCEHGADVVLYTIAGGGHTWPGGDPLPELLVGPTRADVDATRMMWAFFRAHPLVAGTNAPRP